MNMPYLPRVEKEPNFFDKPTIILLILLAVSLFFGVKSCRAEVVDLNTIKQIESAGNPLAVSRTGAIGLYQIMPCVLSEYNSFNKANHSRPDLFNPAVNERIAKWYLTKRIPQMLRYYGKEVNTRNILWAYNAGIGRVVKGFLPEETKQYIKKYQKARS